jgi:hypothetical protein
MRQVMFQTEGGDGQNIPQNQLQNIFEGFLKQTLCLFDSSKFMIQKLK